MMVELGRRVDDSICETYFRNWEDGDDSGVTLGRLSVWLTSIVEDYYLQFLGHFSNEV